MIYRAGLLIRLFLFGSAPDVVLLFYTYQILQRRTLDVV